MGETRRERNVDYVEGVVLYAKEIGGGLIKIILDPDTQSLVTIDHETYFVHQSIVYNTEHVGALDTDGIITVLVVTPNTNIRAHAFFRTLTTLAATVEVYETVATTNDGTALPIYNRNRNSGNSSTVIVKHTPTLDGANGGGTLIRTRYVGTTGKYGGGEDLRHLEEWILKQNTKYLIRLTSNEDSNKVAIIIDWNEHASS